MITSPTMIDETPADSANPAPAGLFNLPEGERTRLGEAMQELLATGSISGLDPARASLYHWCRQYLEWIKEAAALAGLDVTLWHEERLVQATPRVPALRLRLRQDATLVWLALWFAGDTRWRDEGQNQAFLSVGELLDLLHDQLVPEATGLLPRARLREILRQAERFHLIRLELAEPFEESGIEILPAIRRAVPFRDLAAWTTAASAFRKEEVVPDDADGEDDVEKE